MIRGASSFALSCALFAVACSAGDSGDSRGGEASPAGGGASDPSARVGEFSVLLQGSVDGEPGQTKVLGRVADAPAVSDVLWEKKQEAGGCVLKTPRVPFCEMPCGGAICVEDDVCKPSPKALDAGKVTVRGVRTASGEAEFSVEPLNNTYMPVTRLAYPPFEAGDEIEVRAAGADVKAFTLKGQGIAPLELEGSDRGFPLKRGSGLELRWKAPSADVGSRIQVKLDVSHHGGTKGMVECDVADSGSLNIGASLTDALLDLGTAGFPTIVVTRSATTASTTSAGRVDLKVYTFVESAVEIEGLVSCEEASDCPSGMVCEDLKCS